MCGLSLYCHADFRSFRGEIDTLLVPGGGIGVEERKPECGRAANRDRAPPLERTTQSVDEIADCCGFGSADVLARAFTRVLQLTPGEYRSRFRSSGIGK